MQTYQQNNFEGDLEGIVKILSKSPYILTSEGFSSDPFVLMKQIFLSSKTSKAAAILLDSSRNLFKSYGNYAQTYFKMLGMLYSGIRHIQDKEELRNKLQETLANIKFELAPSNSTEDFKDSGYSEEALAAVEEADGSFLSVEKGSKTEIVKEDSKFCFTTDITDFLHIGNATVLVFETEDQDFIMKSVQRTFHYGTPLVIFSTFNSAFLRKFANDNRISGIYFFNARPTYHSHDFFTDFISFVNQSPLKFHPLDKNTAGTALTVMIEDNNVSLSSNRSIQRSSQITKLYEEIQSENSVVRRLLLQKRLINLSYSKTTLKVSANSDKEQAVKMCQFASDIAEISNRISEGYVKNNPLSAEFNGLSRGCFTECLMKAAEDILLCKDSKIIEAND